MDTVFVTLSIATNETLKWLSSLISAVLNHFKINAKSGGDTGCVVLTYCCVTVRASPLISVPDSTFLEKLAVKHVVRNRNQTMTTRRKCISN